MIRFSCYCGHVFNLADDTAGTAIQCPHCGKLRDVPTKDELENIVEDGTYRINQNPTAEDPTRFSKLRRVYSKEKVDETGQEIDLRNPDDDADSPKVEAVPLKEEPEPLPKYDPVTGERIRALDLRESDAADPSLPLGRTSVRYAAAAAANQGEHPSLLLPLRGMLTPGSLVAIVFVFVTQFLVNMLLFVLIVTGIVGGNSAPALAVPFVSCILLAHFANVVQETGPEAADELPGFLRQFHVIDDIWKPFINFMLAVAYSFGPALLANHLLELVDQSQAAIIGILAGLGAITFPAALLTTATSGTILNLRPDRLLGTIKIMGIRYAFCMLIFVASFSLYALGIWITLVNAANWATHTPAPNVLFQGGPAYFTLLLSIYFVHYFLWSLGLAYRADHHKFPWVWQRHEADPSLTAHPAPPPPRQRRSYHEPQPQDSEEIEKPQIDPAAVRARLAPASRPPVNRRRPADRPE